MLLEAEFWVAVAFVIFIAIAWKVGGLSAMTKGLDNRANRIRHELDEAKRLREEAAAVLADYKRRQVEAEKEAQAIVASAREEAQWLIRVVENLLSITRMGDAQARRLKMRVRSESGTYLPHTLNNTVAAPPRMLIALLENNLQADGSVKIPAALQPYMGGTEILVPKH